MNDVANVLCIDGGGVKGRIPAAFLSALESQLGPLHKHFQLFGGTSTGGLIALALGRHFPAKRILDVYQRETRKIFTRNPFSLGGILRAKYRKTPFEEVLRDLFGDDSLDSCNTPTFVTSQSSAGSAIVLRSWSWPMNSRSLVWAARATSAAPMYFPPAEGGYMDGGMWDNTPSHTALLAARTLFPDRRIRIISLGTGRAVRRPRVPKWHMRWGLIGYLPHLHSLMMAGAADDSDDATRQELPAEDYLRLQYPIPDIAMDDTSPTGLRSLDAIAKHYTPKAVAAMVDFLKNKKPRGPKPPRLNTPPRPNAYSFH